MAFSLYVVVLFYKDACMHGLGTQEYIFFCNTLPLFIRKVNSVVLSVCD